MVLALLIPQGALVRAAVHIAIAMRLPYRGGAGDVREAEEVGELYGAWCVGGARGL